MEDNEVFENCKIRSVEEADDDCHNYMITVEDETGLEMEIIFSYRLTQKKKTSGKGKVGFAPKKPSDKKRIQGQGSETDPEPEASNPTIQ